MHIDPLFVDVYPGDRPCDWNAFIAAGPPWHGAIFKLSEGLHLEYAGWAYRQRQSFLLSPRYGIDLFDGFYHYLTIGQDGAQQAEWFWNLTRQVGGERPPGTLWGMVDVERGGQHAALTKTAVETTLGAFAERYHQLSGRRATLYGGELLRAIGASGRYGCDRSAVASYGSELRHYDPAGKRYIGTTEEWLSELGTDLAHTMLWQYRGTDLQSNGPKGYPMTAPGCGANIDINALILPGGLSALVS